MKKLFIICLLLGACAGTQPTLPKEVDVPIAVLPNKIQIDPCPALPLDSLKPEADWTTRLHAWAASIEILQGCVDARDKVITEFNQNAK